MNEEGIEKEEIRKQSENVTELMGNEVLLEEERSSNHQTIDILNCFENDPLRTNHLILNRKGTSERSSLNISKDEEEKNNDTEENQKHDLMGEFEMRWQCIEMSKITKRNSKMSEIKSKSNGNNLIKLQKNVKKHSRFLNRTFKLIQSDSIASNNEIYIQTENDIDNLLKSLNHNKSKNYEAEIKTNCKFININHHTRSNLQSTKPSIINSFISSSKSQEKNVVKRTESIGNNVRKDKCNILNQEMDLGVGVNLRQKFLDTFENILSKNENQQNNENLKTKNLLTRYKDLHSVERNFYNILNDINPKIVKPKKSVFEEVKKEERGFGKRVVHLNKRNKNYLKFEKNFSMISYIMGRTKLK